jgi:hypothetical protein
VFDEPEAADAPTGGRLGGAGAAGGAEIGPGGKPIPIAVAGLLAMGAGGPPARGTAAGPPPEPALAPGFGKVLDPSGIVFAIAAPPGLEPAAGGTIPPFPGGGIIGAVVAETEGADFGAVAAVFVALGLGLELALGPAADWAGKGAVVFAVGRSAPKPDDGALAAAGGALTGAGATEVAASGATDGMEESAAAARPRSVVWPGGFSSSRAAGSEV